MSMLQQVLHNQRKDKQATAQMMDHLTKPARTLRSSSRETNPSPRPREQIVT